MQSNRKADELEAELTGASFNMFDYISLCAHNCVQGNLTWRATQNGRLG